MYIYIYIYSCIRFAIQLIFILSSTLLSSVSYLIFHLLFILGRYSCFNFRFPSRFYPIIHNLATHSRNHFLEISGGICQKQERKEKKLRFDDFTEKIPTASSPHRSTHLLSFAPNNNKIPPFSRLYKDNRTVASSPTVVPPRPTILPPLATFHPRFSVTIFINKYRLLDSSIPSSLPFSPGSTKS